MGRGDRGRQAPHPAGAAGHGHRRQGRRHQARRRRRSARSACSTRRSRQPTKEEKQHDFLWRIRKQLPPPGVVGVFDRSHYEDVLVVRVHDLVPRAGVGGALRRRSTSSRRSSSTTARRSSSASCTSATTPSASGCSRRLDRPDKHWKFNEADLDERALLEPTTRRRTRRCWSSATPTHAPWYLVPSDHKKYRNWADRRAAARDARELDPQYPRPGTGHRRAEGPARSRRTEPSGTSETGGSVADEQRHRVGGEQVGQAHRAGERRGR